MIMPSSQRKPVCFLMCPMDSTRSQRLLEKIVKPVMEERFHFEVQHFFNDRETDKSIRARMEEFIREADVCIADLTDNNPNVHYEYGLRKATGLPVIPIVEKKKREKLIFDVDDFQTISYDTNNPEFAQERIGDIVERAKAAEFNKSRLEITSERRGQAEDLCRRIEATRPDRVDILQCSLLALGRIWDTFWKCPNTLFRLLLMHPAEGVKYGTTRHAARVQHVAGDLQGMAENAQRERRNCPSIGLWYYRHEPSVAAVIVDDKLIQLGWYLRAPRPGFSELVMRGHDQPSVLVVGRQAKPILGPVREHFDDVFRSAELGLCIGPRADELESEWKNASKLHVDSMAVTSRT